MKNPKLFRNESNRIEWEISYHLRIKKLYVTDDFSVKTVLNIKTKYKNTLINHTKIFQNKQALACTKHRQVWEIIVCK